MQITGEADIPIAKEISNAPDRSAAILATSWLDEYLTKAIKSRLLDDTDTTHKLLKPTGPIGALANKAELGYLLRLYSKEARDDLVHISGIRNMFAHWTKPIDFGSRDVHLKCESLTSFDRLWAVHPDYEARIKKSKPFNKDVSRDIFLSTVGIAVNFLNWIVEKDIKESYTKW
jgi:hypothetical protein